MAITCVGTRTYLDDEVPPRCVRWEAEADAIWYHPATFWALQEREAMESAYEYVVEMGTGLWAIPRRLIESEVERAVLMFADPGPSAVCVFPPCGQDATEEVRGYALCEAHAADLADWDALLAP